jgi:hypothetical protein
MSTASRLAKLAEGLDSNGVLSPDKGGTGASTLAAVLTGLGGNATVSTTAPVSPSTGAFWLKDDTGDLHVYAGGSWVLIAGGGGGGGASTPDAISDQANTSTGYFDLPGGTTAQRPATPATGNIRYNTTTGFAEVYTIGGWGSFGSQPPSISTVTPASYNGEQNTTITINGANFSADAQVKFIDNAGTEYPATTVAFVSSTQLTALTPQDFTIAQEPLDVKVVQVSGQTTKVDCIDCGGTPTWTTAAGTLSTLYYPTDTTISTSLVAADPDSNATITYAVTTGALPSGMSLNASTGAITGSVANPAASSLTNSFDITASDNAGNTAVRSFNIIRKWQDGSTEAQAAPSASVIYGLSSTFQSASANGKYWIKLPGNTTATQVYCLMNSGVDSGGWMLSFYKSTGSGTYTYKQLWYANAAWNNTTYTADSTNFPVLPDQTSFGAKGFTKQMFNNQHPSWITNKGNYHWYNLQTNSSWTLNGSISVNNYTISNSTASTTLIYNRGQAWGETANLDTTWAWWADAGNYGLCGGANICGTTACPTASAAEGCHTNGSYPTLIFVK